MKGMLSDGSLTIWRNWLTSEGTEGQSLQGQQGPGVEAPDTENKEARLDLAGGPVVKNPPANVGDMG